MPALTTSQLHRTHSQYLDASDITPQAFRFALNEIMPRIYKMGFWREMMVEHTQEASSGYVSLPPDTDAVIAGILDNDPLPTRSLWHDYKLFGTNDQDTTTLNAFIDDGYAPTYRDLDSANKYKIRIVSLKAPYTALSTEGKITFKFRNLINYFIDQQGNIELGSPVGKVPTIKNNRGIFGGLINKLPPELRRAGRDVLNDLRRRVPLGRVTGGRVFPPFKIPPLNI